MRLGSLGHMTRRRATRSSPCDGWRVTAQKRSDDAPDEPETGLEWAWEMVHLLARGEPREDPYAAEERREPRLVPVIDRFALLELLAERAPDDDALGFLGADALQEYLGSSPDVARVEQTAQRNEVFA
jgi:hypothetical protein